MANTRIFPMLWESHLWCAETDAALLLALVAAPPQPAAGSALAHKNRLAARVASTVRWQMGLFYLGAAFWKVNTSFLDHRYSCAPLFFGKACELSASPPVALESCEGTAIDQETTPNCAAAFADAGGTGAGNCPQGCDYLGSDGTRGHDNKVGRR